MCSGGPEPSDSGEAGGLALGRGFTCTVQTLEQAGCSWLCQQRGHAAAGWQRVARPGFAPFCSPGWDEYSGAGETFPLVALRALSRIFLKSPLSSRLSARHRLSAALSCWTPTPHPRRTAQLQQGTGQPGLGTVAIRSWPHSGISG